MIERRPGLTVVVMVAVAILAQTTLFARVRLVGVAPDLVVLAVAIATLRLADVPSLVTGFVAGMLMDALGSNALGLRAVVLTLVAYVALRTRDRADVGPLAVAVWVAGLTLVGVALLLLLGTLFDQIGLTGGEALRRLLLVPVLNLVAALVVSPLTGRMLEAGSGRRVRL